MAVEWGHRAAFMVAFAIALAGCSGDVVIPVGQTTPTPTPTPTEFVNGGECPLVPDQGLPRAGCATSVSGDFDGDGGLDKLTVFAALRKDLKPRDWYTKVEMAFGNIEIKRLEAGNAFSYPHVAGAADVDGDGRYELFVKVVDLAGHGAPWQQLGLFVWRHRTLSAVTHRGAVLALRVGGVTRMGEGIGCRKGRLVVLRAEAQDVHNVRWVYSERTYQLRGTAARFIKRTSGKLRLSDYNDPALDPYYELNCGRLHYE